MKCISYVSYSVLINGAHIGNITPQRGIRQDDSIIFCKAKKKECQALLQVLQEYKEASGQEVNFQKSAIMFSKEIMLKAVVTALPAYRMSCFFIPKKIINEISAAMRRFWWSSSKDKHKISWVTWDKITDTKKMGGLGIRDLSDFNIALIAKQSWRILQDPNSLVAKVYKEKYFPKSDLLEAKRGMRPSHAWRGILQGTNLLSQGLKWNVGDGEQIKVWKDKWIPTTPPRPTRGIGASDHVSWIHTKDGTYSVKSETLKRRGINVDTCCGLCGEEPENVNHLIFRCRVSSEIWQLATHSDQKDGSWTSPNQPASIGWSLHDKYGRKILRGSSSVDPTINPLETEAEALRIAVTQVKRLGFTEVTFCGDAEALYKPICNDWTN